MVFFEGNRACVCIISLFWKMAFLPDQNAPEEPLRFSDGIFHSELESAISFPITATSAKWQPFPVSLAFCCVERQWRGKILELRRVIKTSRAHLRCFDDSTQLEDFTEPLAFRAAEGQWNRKWLSFGGSSSYWEMKHISIILIKIGI